MAIEHAMLGQPLGARRHHILLPDFLEERILGEEGRGREGRHDMAIIGSTRCQR